MLLKNTWLFARQHTTLFVLLILTQLAAIVGILLSYGIALNNQYNLKAAERDFHEIRILFSGEDVQLKATIQAINAFPEILEEYEDVFKAGYTQVWAPCDISCGEDYLVGLDGKDEEGNIKKIRVTSNFGIKGEKYSSTDTASTQMKRVVGKWFDDVAINVGEKQCIIDDDMHRLVQNELVLAGVVYEIIAYEPELQEGPGLPTFVQVPFESLIEGMGMEVLSLMFTRPLTHTEYSEIYSRMVEVFGPIPEYEDECSLDIDEKATMHTMIINSVLIALLASFTVCLLYRYLLEKRKVMTAVYEICGCTGWRAAGVYIGEMLLLFVCTTISGMLVFWYVIKPCMEKSFPWFSAIYKGETAFRLVGVYAAVVLVVVTVMICGVTKKQPKEILREG